MGRLIVAIHDVAPQSVEAAQRWRALVGEQVEGPVALLVVPRDGGWATWRGDPGGDWLRERAQGGDEIVLHGWTHTTPSGQHGAEFARRSRGEVTARLSCGKRDLERIGLVPSGLIAPCYQSPGTAGLTDEVGIDWIATRWRVSCPRGFRLVPSLGAGASTRFRRDISSAAVAAGVALVRPFDTVRLDLHPADLDHQVLAGVGLRALRRLVQQGRHLVTHDEVVARGSRT